MKQIYRNLNLQTKLMLSYLIVISIPMLVIAVFLYGKVYNMIVADTIRAEQALSAQAAPAVEAAISRLLGDFKDIQALPFYQQVMEAETGNGLNRLVNGEAARHFTGQVEAILNRSLADGDAAHQPTEQAKTILGRSLANGDAAQHSTEQAETIPDRSLVDRDTTQHPTEQAETILGRNPAQCLKIYLDLPSAAVQPLQHATDGIFESLQDTENTYWRGIFAGSQITALHCPNFYLSNYEIQNYGSMAYITKDYLHMDGEPVLCYSAMYYSADLYLAILEENLPGQGSVSYIINDRDSIIATTNPALSSTYYLNYATIQDSFMSSNNFLQKEVLGQTVYAGLYNIKQPGWYMLVVIPSLPLLRKSQMLLLQYVAMFLACIAAALCLAITLSHSITQRLALVIARMSKVRTGPPIPLDESQVHDEIGDLIDTYNYMSREMNRLLTEMEKAGEELRIAEFRSLQAQINPHFLYNTMDMINWMAVQNRTSEIADAVLSLSRFYKLTLSKKGSHSTIAQETEHVSIYLRLQNMRCQGRIDFIVDIPDILSDYGIPKLTLQPIVENAVLHGILEKEEKAGTIVLTGWKEGDTIVLLITDDGVGIPAAKLDQILAEKQSSQKKGTNIAVYNTHHRLQILYGEQYGLSYASVPDQGTEVSIRIPAGKSSGQEAEVEK